MRDIYILGAGPYAKKIYACAISLGLTVRAFIVESSQVCPPVPDCMLVEENEFNLKEPECFLFIAVGEAKKREYLMNVYRSKEWIIPTLIHPNSIVSNNADINEGTFVGPGCIIESDCVVGRGCIIDIGVLIDHDCNVPPFSHLKSASLYSHKDFAQ